LTGVEVVVLLLLSGRAGWCSPFGVLSFSSLAFRVVLCVWGKHLRPGCWMCCCDLVERGDVFGVVEALAVA
jgi:hypothetical protein